MYSRQIEATIVAVLITLPGKGDESGRHLLDAGNDGVDGAIDDHSDQSE